MQLVPHPATPGDPVRALTAVATWQDGRRLRLKYRLEADLSRLRLPVTTVPARADDLWRRTCFEAFVAAPGSSGYSELNFSPSGAWAAYTFTGHRTGMRAARLDVAPAATWRRTDERLELDVAIGLEGLLSAPVAGTLRLALSAVIEGESGTISYWALRHPEGQPDFHHPDGFVLELPAYQPANTRGA